MPKEKNGSSVWLNLSPQKKALCRCGCHNNKRKLCGRWGRHSKRTKGTLPFPKWPIRNKAISRSYVDTAEETAALEQLLCNITGCYGLRGVMLPNREITSVKIETCYRLDKSTADCWSYWLGEGGGTSAAKKTLSGASGASLAKLRVEAEWSEREM